MTEASSKCGQFWLYYCMYFLFCFFVNILGTPSLPIDPCMPSPCGPNSQCRVIGDTPVCSCLPDYVGRAPSCRPECITSAECPGHLACINEKCRDPCAGSCGLYATCLVSNHQPICNCIEGYTGDPFCSCSPIPSNENHLNNHNTLKRLLLTRFGVLEGLKCNGKLTKVSTSSFDS